MQAIHIIGITIRQVPLSSSATEKGKDKRSQLGIIGGNRVLVRRRATRSITGDEKRQRENWLRHFCRAVKGQYENFTRASSSHELYAPSPHHATRRSSSREQQRASGRSAANVRLHLTPFHR